MRIDILYEDGEALVIDKPAGLPIEKPRRGGPSLEDHIEQLKLGFQRPPVPVHRLDTDTPRCLLLARAFEERRVAKRYLGILAGEIADENGTIDLSLSKISSAEKGWRMIAAKKGKPSVTHWRRLTTRDGLTMVEFRPETGRTHQIRIHALAGLGVPLLGDPVYGKPDPRVKRAMLHAAGLTVQREGKLAIEALAPLPARFRRWVKSPKKRSRSPRRSSSPPPAPAGKTSTRSQRRCSCGSTYSSSAFLRKPIIGLRTSRAAS